MMANMCDHNLQTFLSTNFPVNYIHGSVLLPSSFLTKYIGIVPSKVYVQLPNKSLWRGMYNISRNCIEGLQQMFEHYGVRQYHMVILYYNGGHRFGMEIYNMYGVEIHYNGEPRPATLMSSPTNEAIWVNDRYYLSSDIQMDKLSAQFAFNCHNSGQGDYDLIISKSHLQPKIYNQLGMDNSVCSVEIGFKNLFYKIDMHWINAELFFNKNWCDFVKAGNLCEGDICVFQKSSIPNKFKVAVYEKKNMANYNRSGVSQGKSIMKWLKVINSDMKATCEVDVPRLFIEEYGILLIENVHLLMPNGAEFCVHFCEETNKLQRLQTIMLKYSIKEDYVFFFDFVGRSHFLVSVYNDRGEDLFAGLRHKAILKDVMRQTECPLVTESHPIGGG